MYLFAPHMAFALIRRCNVSFFIVAIAVSYISGPSMSVFAAEPATAEDLIAVRKLEQQRIQVIDQVIGSVVCIYGMDRAGGGSGVLFSADGYALTNDHVVSAAGYEGLAGLSNGELYRWRLVGTDPGGDLAIIQLQGRPEGGFPVSPLGNSDQMRVGDWVMAMGNPFALAEDQRPSVSLGVVSGVHRYQAGQGMNRLVYGNCFQVDAAINPGNSGGPLFNLLGQVIGINGRCSFDERGRVNVGLGYAISSNQARMFVPELLSTKVTQHGTLDVVFASRTEGVVCESMNVDSAIAKKGLKLGDRLLAVEGVKIQSANQLTSLMSTYPAGWPVRVEFESEGLAKTCFVRLAALPYEKQVSAEAPKVQPKEGTPKRIVMDISRAGKVREAELNKQVAQEIWIRASGEKGLGLDKCLVVQVKGMVDGERGAVLLAGDGRFAVAWHGANNQSWWIGFDGTKYLRGDGTEEPKELTQGKAMREPMVTLAMALSRQVSRSPGKDWKPLVLDGADQVQRRPQGEGEVCARLSSEEASGERLYLWIDHVDVMSPKPELVKVAVGIEDDEPIPGVLLRQWREWDAEEAPGSGEKAVGNLKAKVRLPAQWDFVLGLEERVQQQMVVKGVLVVKASDLPSDVVKWPTELGVADAN